MATPPEPQWPSGGWETEIPDTRNSPSPTADFWLRA